MWVRLYAFSSCFVPKCSSKDYDFGMKVGDTIEGLIAPSYGYYGTAVLEAWDRIEPKEFDRQTEAAHKCLDPWSNLFF